MVRIVKPHVTQVLFVQGGGSGTHDSWDNKLVASLEQALGSGYQVRYPPMPDEDDPNPDAWKKTIARELAQTDDGVVLVGHSIGAAILLDFLADGGLKHRAAGVFLVAAPFIGKNDGGWPSDDLRPSRQAAAALTGDTPLFFYRGDKDETIPAAHLDLFAKALPRATIRRLAGRDHQLNDDLSEVARDILDRAGNRS